MDHQDSYGCRGCSHGDNVCALPGTGPRRAGGAQAAPAPRSATGSSVFTDGPRLRRQRDTPTGAGAGVRARCSACSRPVSTPGSTTGRGTRGATKSNACSELEGLSPYLLSFRETRCTLPRFHLVRTHLRCVMLVLTGPSRIYALQQGIRLFLRQAAVEHHPF